MSDKTKECTVAKAIDIIMSSYDLNLKMNTGKKMTKVYFGSCLTLSLALTACHAPSVDQRKALNAPIGMPNPASVYCVEQGGSSIPKRDAQGNEYALCRLPTGQTIEEWEFFRKNHPQN